MGLDLGDHAFAIALRKRMRKIAAKVVNEMRPEYRYAHVTGIDRYNRKCLVQYIGEEGKDPISVSMGGVQPQATGVLVRVAGKAGDKYIDEVCDWTTTTFQKNTWIRPLSGSLGAIVWWAAIDPNPDWATFISGEAFKFYNANVGSGTDVLALWHISPTNPKGKVVVQGQFQLGGGVQHGVNYSKYVRTATAQSIAPNTWTDLSWDTLGNGVEDDGAMLRSGDGRYLQCGTQGFFTCTVFLKMSAFTGFIGLEIYRDDGQLLAEMPPFDGASLLDPNVSFSASFPLAAGQGVRVQMRHNHTSNITVTNGTSGSSFCLAQVAA